MVTFSRDLKGGRSQPSREPGAEPGRGSSWGEGPEAGRSRPERAWGPACPSNSPSNLTGSPDLSEASVQLWGDGLCALPSCAGQPAGSSLPGSGRRKAVSSSTPSISPPPRPAPGASPILGSGTGLSMSSTHLPRSGKNPTAKHLLAHWGRKGT